MGSVKKQKEHADTSRCRRVLKMGAEITPPVFQFFKKENGGLKYDFQTASTSQIARSL